MKATVYQTLECDVLVIGGGGAGVRAALTAAKSNERVLMISETPVGESGSTFYPLSFEWGMLCASDATDAKLFTQEILNAAGACINPKLAEYLAMSSRRAHDRFVTEGLPLVSMKELGITGCFGKEPRGVFLLDMEAFVKSQKELVAQNGHISFMALTAISLVIKEEKCMGAMAVDSQGRLIHLSARAVVLACGGGEGLYCHRASFGSLYGNAYAMAARHRARIVNLEFIQFVLGTVSPIRFANYFPFLLTEHPHVTNAHDEDCMAQYLPDGCTVERCLDMHAKHGPFSTEDEGKYLEYAMIAEEKKGNGMGLKLWPDATRLKDKRGRQWRVFLRRLGYDESTVMQLYPMCQGFNGGILLKDDLTTDIEGLFACGESSGGLHGPDRMGGLCILATQVFGEAAGRLAGEYTAKGRPVKPLSADEALRGLMREFDFHADSDLSPGEVLEQIRQIMQENACLRRNEKGLTDGLHNVEQLHIQPLAHLNTPEAAAYFRVANALDAARLILTAMRNRRESRGCHDREDYPAHNSALDSMQWVSIRENRVEQGTVGT